MASIDLQKCSSKKKKKNKKKNAPSHSKKGEIEPTLTATRNYNGGSQMASKLTSTSGPSSSTTLAESSSSTSPSKSTGNKRKRSESSDETKQENKENGRKDGNSETNPTNTDANPNSKAKTNSKKTKRKRANSHASDKSDKSDKSDQRPTVPNEHSTKSQKSQPNTHAPNTFQSITPPLSPSILTFLSTPPYHFPTPTPVQSTTLPLFLTHHDVVVRAVTGSGKTLAFLIPVVEMILRRTVMLKKNLSGGSRGQIGGLILEPTRELARQVWGVARDLCGSCGMSEPLLLVGGGGSGNGGKSGSNGSGGNGGGSVAHDLQLFQKLQSDIVIGTPGRVEDVLTRYDNIDVSELEVLILDESDVLLDMGFEVTLTSILSRLPKMRRTGLFSATNTSGVKRLVTRAGMRNPVVVDVAISAISANEGHNAQVLNGGEKSETISKESNNHHNHQQATPSTLTNYYLLCPLTEKLSRLLSFLHQHSSEKVIVFFLTCACVEFYSAALKELKPPCKGYEYEALHGKLVQKRREKAMERFRERGAGSAAGATGAGSALLCTDVAARGLDVPDVSWTIQFDAPVDPSSYVHRVGRSARAGRIGNSLVFLSPKEDAYVDFLQLRKVPVRELPDGEVCKPPSVEEEEEEEVEEMKGDGEEGDDGGDGNDHDDESSGEDDEMDTSKDETSESKMDKGSKSKNNKATKDSSDMARIIKSAAGPNVVVPDVLPAIRKMVLKDRDILEKGTKAYTSYIRAYKEHHCGFIFRFASLDLGALATSFCLLRLPKMPELRDKAGKLNFQPAGPEVDIHAIPFKDKVREAARQKRLAAELAAGGKNAKQIKAEQRAAERIRKSKERREKEIAKGRNPNKKRGRQARIFDEWDELAKEERLYKKLRSNKISKEEYDRLMYGDGGKGEDAFSDGSSDDDSD